MRKGTLRDADGRYAGDPADDGRYAGDPADDGGGDRDPANDGEPVVGGVDAHRGDIGEYIIPINGATGTVEQDGKGETETGVAEPPVRKRRRANSHQGQSAETAAAETVGESTARPAEKAKVGINARRRTSGKTSLTTEALSEMFAGCFALVEASSPEHMNGLWVVPKEESDLLAAKTLPVLESISPRTLETVEKFSPYLGLAAAAWVVVGSRLQMMSRIQQGIKENANRNPLARPPDLVFTDGGQSSRPNEVAPEQVNRNGGGGVAVELYAPDTSINI